MKTKLTIYRILLITLISSTSITGIGFLDDQIWNLVFLIIGMATYGIVGLLYSVKAISSNQVGKTAYSAVFLILLFVGYCIYQGIVKLQSWVISWPLTAKISVSIVFVLFIIFDIIAILKIKSKNKIDNANPV